MHKYTIPYIAAIKFVHIFNRELYQIHDAMCVYEAVTSDWMERSAGKVKKFIVMRSTNCSLTSLLLGKHKIRYGNQNADCQQQ